MNIKKNKKKYLLYGTVVVLLVLSVVIFKATISADSSAADNNKIRIKTARISEIKTGTPGFDASDGVVEDENGEITSYDKTGKDSSDSNRIIRSNDELEYTIDFSIAGKNDDNVYNSRNVDITVSLSADEARYVTFDPNKAAGETSKTYTISNVSSTGVYDKKITLYVVNAPAETQISPKFTIKESTDSETPVILGKNDNGNIEYEFEDRRYTSTNVSTVANYMPTLVSSREIGLQYITSVEPDGQKAIYNGQLGRFFTGVVSVYIPNAKGVNVTTDSLSLPISTSNSGTGQIVLNDNWIRLYNKELADIIEPVITNTAYSISDGATASNQTRYPGTVSGSGGNISISGIKVPYTGPSVAANNTPINENKILGSYAISLFAPRMPEDGKETKTVTLNVGNESNTFANDYYEDIDYNLESGFYDESGNGRLTKYVNNKGEIVDLPSSTSKGSTITYKTTFKYKKTGSDSGIKQVLKVDPLAFRVIPIEDRKDVDVKVTCGDSDCKNISKDDFEFKYITGDFSSDKYTFGELDQRVSQENREYASNRCAALAGGTYTREQIMNLYGGPCIKGTEETTYDKINDARDESDNEIPITKVVIQTKEGVKLPDDAVVTFLVKLRVRNVADITRSYQAGVVLSTSDYDSELYYFAPEINQNGVKDIMDPDNFIKGVFTGNNVAPLNTTKYADSIRIVNMTARQELTVTNKKSDGQVKLSYETDENEVIQYKLSTKVEDMSEEVGADDVWYITNMVIDVEIPNTLDYIPDDSLGTPGVSDIAGGKKLSYVIPYTKTNHKIPDIYFNTKLSSNLEGTEVPITVKATLNPININGEFDASYINAREVNFTIYGTESKTVLLSQTNEGPTVIDKDATINYILNVKNNTGNEVNNYILEDILPYKDDKTRGSSFSGSYDVMVELPNSQPNAKLYCSKNDPKTISGEVTNTNDGFEECAADEDFVKATAIRITGINLGTTDADKVMDPIKIILRTKNNKYDDKLANDFIGGTAHLKEKKSNKITYRVINRTISGRVFVDSNEDGIRNEKEKLLENMVVNLYKVENGKLTEAAKAVKTNKNGEYKFDKLDAGIYRVRIEYSNDTYDLTLRYASDNTATDSDAYKISDGLAEISGKYEPGKINGIDLTVFTKNKVEDMDMGLIPRQTFGFTMKKYITQVDLSYNNVLDTKKYNNLSTVALSVRNTSNATAKIYYGMSITNTASTPGYIELVDEDIPNGLTFDASDPYNAQWAMVEGRLQSKVFEDMIVQPGETKYLQIALYMPSRESGETFINNVSAEVKPYVPTPLAKEAEFSADSYSVGNEVEYAGIKWNVINAVDGPNEGEQTVTLLAQSGTISSPMKNGTGSVYKWGDSTIKNYINSYESNGWLSTTALNTAVLYDQVVCNDASSLQNTSFGGSLQTAGVCTSNDYVKTKVRLLNQEDYDRINTMSSGQGAQSDLSWLYGNSDFWMMDAVDSTIYHDIYGRQTSSDNHTLDTSVNTLAKYISKNSSNVATKDISQTLEVRPVITISSKNLIGN